MQIWKDRKERDTHAQGKRRDILRKKRERQRNTLINEFWCFKKYCWIGSYEI